MGFLLRILIGLTLISYSNVIFAFDTSRAQLEAKIKVKETELNALKQELEKKNSKKIAIKTSGKNAAVSESIGAKADEVPCTCVFNKNRMWNPEKVMWNNAYWKCSIYKDDGTCSEVQKIRDVSFE